jgi:hypothetical protein
MVHEAEMVAPGHAVKRIVRRRERNDVHVRRLRQLNGALDGFGVVVPVEQQIFPLHDRLAAAARVAIGHHFLHCGVGFFKTAAQHVFLHHFIADAVQGKPDDAQVQGRFALGVGVEQNAVRGDNDAAIGQFGAQQRQFLADGGRQERLAEVQIK